jgi:hypothetical protein
LFKNLANRDIVKAIFGRIDMAAKVISQSFAGSFVFLPVKRASGWAAARSSL